MSWKTDREARKDARVAFMRKHPELWDKSKEEIVEAYRANNLIAASTYWGDVRTENDIKAARALNEAAGK